MKKTKHLIHSFILACCVKQKFNRQNLILCLQRLFLFHHTCTLACFIIQISLCMRIIYHKAPRECNFTDLLRQLQLRQFLLTLKLEDNRVREILIPIIFSRTLSVYAAKVMRPPVIRMRWDHSTSFRVSMRTLSISLFSQHFTILNRSWESPFSFPLQNASGLR